MITVMELKSLIADGQKELYLEPDTIITPAARDEAVQRGIVLQTHAPSEPVANSQKVQEKSSIDSKLIEKIVREVLATLPELQSKELDKIIDPGGAILIRQNSTNNKKVQEILGKAESPKLGCGFITLEGDSFDKSSGCDEVNYILEGSVTLSVDGRSYQGKAGDVFYIPKGIHLALSAQSKAIIFFVAKRSC